MAGETLTPHEKEHLRALRAGRAVSLSPKEHLRLRRRSLIRGVIDKPSLTVVGCELAAQFDQRDHAKTKL